MRRFRFRLLPTTDWHFAKRFLSLLGLSLAALLVLLIVGDLSQKTDEFAEYASKTDKDNILVLSMVVRYYLLFAPAMVLQYMVPLAMMIAGILTVTSSIIHNEYVVLRSSGISLQRSIVPLLLAAFLASYAFQLTRDWYLPYLVRQSHVISTEIKPTGNQPLSLVKQDGDMLHHISMGHFDLFENRYIAHNLRIETRKAKTFQTGAGDFTAYTAWEAYLQPRTDIVDIAPGDNRELQWSPLRGAQKMQHSYYENITDDWSAPVPTYVTPAMLERQALGESVMTWDDLSHLAKEDLDVRMEMHRRITAPWANTALLLAGLSIVLWLTARGGEASHVINIVIALLLCGGFYILVNAFNTMGETRTLSPLLAAWLPVLMTAAGGILLARRLGR